MDLNASPLPEDDDQPSQELVDDEILDQPIQESSVQTLHREREERRRRLKRENQDECPRQQHSQSTRNDFITPSKASRYAGKIRPIPQGWLDCHSYGKCLGGSIVPSKVPLDETYNDAVIPGRRYSSKQVINGQRRFGRELGLVIDLTNTSRYYSPLEYTRLGIKYIKIACKGRDSVPDNESVNRFVFEVMQFIGRQKHSHKTLLVHCTHGHNRTGFMIVHYLVRTKLCSVTEALREFDDARPPGIYKRDYVEALYTFYHECPEKMVCPPTPDWKRSSDLDLNGEAVQDQDDDDDFDNSGHLHEQHMENGPITNDDVLGDAICYDEQEFLRQKCYSLFELFPTGKGTSQFPGSHPVSLNRDNLQLLRQRYYYATWKADGTRYMMLIALHGCFLIDRNFCFRRVQLRFPLKEFEGCLFHHYTLIDGEMIIDAVPDIGLKRRYLAYDLIALNNKSVIKLPFSERWKLLEEEVIRPRNNEKKYIEREGRGNLTYRYEMEPFGVRRKDFWLLSTVGKLLKGFIPSLSHASDGLIFQGWDDPYVPRTHEGLLKWKYPEMNSVDFLLEIGPDNRQLVYLYERGKKKLMDGCRVAFKDDDDDDAVQDYSGKIIECSWDQENGCWVCMRVRTDKSTPNDINTYRKVMRSISDNITEDVLLNEISEIVRLPMYADRIEKAQKLQNRRRFI